MFKNSTFHRRPARALLGALSLAIILVVAYCASLSPSTTRPWVQLQSRMPVVLRSGPLVHIDSIRDYEFRSESDFTPAYISATYNADSITSAWFVLTPFSRSWRGPAHSFVSFGFSDGRFLSISVEARRELGETYGPVLGVLNKFELIYVIGTERDLIGQRAAFAPYPLYLYPVRADLSRVKAVFLEMTARAQGLRARPEFYNTLTNNCTSNVVVHVNHFASHKVSGGLKAVFPGYIDEVAHSMGLIDTPLSLEGARARFRVDPATARSHLSSPDFSIAIRRRAGLPGLP